MSETWTPVGRETESELWADMSVGVARAGAAHGAAVLDREILAENTMRDASLQKELFDLYFGQSASWMDSLRAGLAEGACRPWRDAAHSLKGTARTLGLMRLAAACAAAEASAPSASLLRAVEDGLVEARAAAAAYVAQTIHAA